MYYCEGMKTLTVALPDNVEFETSEIMMVIAAKLYERGILSQGKAAELAGRSRREFLESLGEYGVSVFNYPASDLARDVRNA